MAIDLSGQTDFTAERNGVNLGLKFGNPPVGPRGTSCVAAFVWQNMVSNRVFRDLCIHLWGLPVSLVRTLWSRRERSAICAVVYVDCGYCLSDVCVDLHRFPSSPKEASVQKRKPREFWQIDRVATVWFATYPPIWQVTSILWAGHIHTLGTATLFAGHSRPQRFQRTRQKRRPRVFERMHSTLSGKQECRLRERTAQSTRRLLVV